MSSEALALQSAAVTASAKQYVCSNSSDREKILSTRARAGVEELLVYNRAVTSERASPSTLSVLGGRKLRSPCAASKAAV